MKKIKVKSKILVAELYRIKYCKLIYLEDYKLDISTTATMTELLDFIRDINILKYFKKVKATKLKFKIIDNTDSDVISGLIQINYEPLRNSTKSS